ncbi:unnamed protein product [Linum tenue]|uniref:C2HC zinc finger plants domain-containing protein n=1 Tax=Linum tenue TaxID=586396 RepID=A0AAV0P3U7_9ROSI|nr:unnamed protein product [Linum tenue]
MDSEMMETETPIATATAAPVNPSGDIRELFALARQLINQGKPSQALQVVMAAARNQGGDQAMFQSLSRARELYRTRLQESSNSIDQLATLFAECAIAGTESSQSANDHPMQHNRCSESGGIGQDVHENSILAETGRNQIVLDAFADGSSFICLQCGGLVSVNRRDEHLTYWCGN